MYLDVGASFRWYDRCHRVHQKSRDSAAVRRICRLTLGGENDYPRPMEMQMGYEVFAELDERDHEQVVFCNDKESGLKANIGIHNTTLGPALGGCRMYPILRRMRSLCCGFHGV